MEFISPTGLPPAAGYTHVVTVEPGRKLAYISGQIGMRLDGTVAEGWEAQTRHVFENLTLAIAAAGGAWSDVVKLTYFVTSTDAITTIRAIRDEYVETSRPPASSLVQVAALFRPDLLIEVEAVAAVA